MSFFATYGIGVFLTSSFFILHHVLAALKSSSAFDESHHWDDVTLLVVGSALIYCLGFLTQKMGGLL